MKGHRVCACVCVCMRDCMCTAENKKIQFQSGEYWEVDKDCKGLRCQDGLKLVCVDFQNRNSTVH